MTYSIHPSDSTNAGFQNSGTGNDLNRNYTQLAILSFLTRIFDAGIMQRNKVAPLAPKVLRIFSTEDTLSIVTDLQ
jgi:hypothetical protein